MDNPYTLSLSKYSTHNVVLQNIGKNKLVLDVGCNDGYIGKHSDKSNLFYGLDHLPSAVRQAKLIYNDASTYDLNVLKKLPWNKSFDVIIFADVLEHVVDPVEVLRYFVDNYLASDGIVILSLPNIANWQIRLRLLLGQFNSTDTGIMDKTHLHFYTYKTTRKLLTDCKLEITKEYAGTSFFGYVVQLLPFTKAFFATSIIIHAQK